MHIIRFQRTVVVLHPPQFLYKTNAHYILEGGFQRTVVVFHLPQLLYKANAHYKVLKNKQFLSYLTGFKRFYGKDNKITQ